MKYKRILLKLSGEVLGGVSGVGIDPDAAAYFAQEIKQIHDNKVQTGIVIGGGNIFRGAKNLHFIERVTGDHMGMLATVINALALRDTFRQSGMDTEVMGPASVSGKILPFDRGKALAMLQEGTVLIFAGGTGNPFFTTDSAAALRACEIDADILLKGTKVDGVYSADPMLDKTAVRYDKVSYQQALKDELHVMDMSALALCRQQDMPVMVFNFTKRGELFRALSGEAVGTVISNNK